MNFLINLLSSGTDSTAAPAGCTAGDALIWIIPLALLVGFWILQGRQRKKQQEEVQKKMDALKVGDVVKTIGLIYGEIVEIDRDMETFVLKTGSEENFSFIKVDKMAIYQVIPPIDPQPEEQFGEEGQAEEAFEETTEVTEENN
ncbi:MAG: preprotein translocase subunit YajC [Clostridiales bacterium]|nr:preprotein translocase subunit YajC [Clostridiales bacterium]